MKYGFIKNTKRTIMVVICSAVLLFTLGGCIGQGSDNSGSYAKLFQSIGGFTGQDDVITGRWYFVTMNGHFLEELRDFFEFNSDSTFYHGALNSDHEVINSDYQKYPIMYTIDRSIITINSDTSNPEAFNYNISNDILSLTDKNGETTILAREEKAQEMIKDRKLKQESWMNEISKSLASFPF